LNQTAFARGFLVQSLVRGNIHSFPSISFGIASNCGTLDPLIVGTAGSYDGHGPIAMEFIVKGMIGSSRWFGIEINIRLIRGTIHAHKVQKSSLGCTFIVSVECIG